MRNSINETDYSLLKGWPIGVKKFWELVSSITILKKRQCHEKHVFGGVMVPQSLFNIPFARDTVS